ncbi:MAG TPA: FAD-dependent monooxygenase [Coriobacteriia bacterium]
MTIPVRDTYDTVVAGAGPAGVMAAYHAAERGSVLLIDASSLPRDKSCGGMIHGLTRDALAGYGEIPDDIVLGPRYVNFRYVDWDRDVRKPTELAFLNVDRAGFDDWLVSLLPGNVEVVGGAVLTTFTQDGDGVRVTAKSDGADFIVSCVNLVGADGARSAVRRALGVDAGSTYVTLQDYVTLKGVLEPYFDCIYMRSLGDGFGYGYVMPKGDVAVVGSVFYPKTKRPWEKQDRLLEILRAQMPQLGATVKREACSALYLRTKADVVPGSGRVLLAGEAGGFMSPTSGEGISYAVRSGILAGRAIAGSTASEALASYTSLTAPLRSDIARRLRWLPFMESRFGKWVGGLTPTWVVSRITEGL